MTTTQTKPVSPNDTKPTLGLGKPAAAETKAAPEAKVSLKAICSEMKLDPRIAREKLRIAVREAKKFPELAKSRSRKLLSSDESFVISCVAPESQTWGASCGSLNTVVPPIVGPAVSQRSDGCRMGVDRADDPAGQARRPSARGECPRGSKRHLLRAFDRLPMAGAAQGPAAQEHGALLLHAVGLGRHAGAPPPRALCRDARARRARGQPDGRDHRQPERQGRSKGGSALDPQGFDAGKKVTGRKRHILVDTLGLLLNVVVHPADVQDRDGARLVLDQRTRRLFPFIERIFADAGYQGAKTAAAVAKTGRWAGDRQTQRAASLRRPAQALDRRAHPRLDQPQPPPCRDFERYARTVAAFIRLAMIRIMLRRLTRSNHSPKLNFLSAQAPLGVGVAQGSAAEKEARIALVE